MHIGTALRTSPVEHARSNVTFHDATRYATTRNPTSQRINPALTMRPDDPPVPPTSPCSLPPPGFHEFAEFVAEDVGTVDSGLNSMVLASNNEAVLLPVNEPTFGTPRKSQIQTYLEQNEGPGLQHLALMTHDIFHTLRWGRRGEGVGVVPSGPVGCGAGLGVGSEGW